MQCLIMQLSSDVFTYVLIISKDAIADPFITSRNLHYTCSDIWQFDDLPEEMAFPVVMKPLAANSNGFLRTRHYHRGLFINMNDNSVSSRSSSSSLSSSSAHMSSAPTPIDYSLLFDWLLKVAPTSCYHMLLSFLDLNDLIYGLRRINHSIRNEASWSASSLWWKNRLRNERGPSVVRWSDATLSKWAHEFGQNSMRSLPFLSWPLWFAAAVHLQCRRNRFRRDMMHIDSLQQTQRLTDVRVTSGFVRPHFEVPRALRDFLLLSPPFHPPPTQLTAKSQLCVNTAMLLPAYPITAIDISDIAWFAADASRYVVVGLWLGTVFAYENEQNNSRGRFFANFHENDFDFNPDFDKISLMVDNIENSKRIREYYYDNSNEVPIVEWSLFPDSRLKLAARNISEWMTIHQCQVARQILIDKYNAAESVDHRDGHHHHHQPVISSATPSFPVDVDSSTVRERLENEFCLLQMKHRFDRMRLKYRVEGQQY